MWLIALFASAWADDIDVSSRVEAVTVFQGRARVTRVATVRVPAGRSDLVFDDLPIGADDRSMSAEGEGRATLLGVDMRAVRGTEDRDERLRELRAQRQELADRIAVQRDRVSRVTADIAFLKSVQPKAQETLSEPLFLADDAASQLATLSAGLQDDLRDLLREQRAAERSIRELTAEQGALDRELAQIGAQTRDAKRAAVGIDASVAGTVTVRLSYLTNGANWTPTYDARFDPESNQVRLDLSGVVTQSTGEDWLDAPLTLSTGAATRGTEPPELSPFTLGQSAGYRSAPAAVSQVVEFTAARTVDVPSDGSTRQVRLASVDLDATLVHKTVPRREPVAYLTARVVNEAEWPLLPGEVRSYLGSAFVGTGFMSATPPEGEIDLSFGVDDRVAVERVRITDLQLSSRALSNRERQAWGFETRVTNRTGEPITLVVSEQVPASREDRFQVDATVTPEVELPADGVFSWEANVADGATQTFKLEYEISWPQGERPHTLD